MATSPMAASILTDDSLIQVVSITKDADGNDVTSNMPIPVKLGDLAAYIVAKVPETTP